MSKYKNTIMIVSAIVLFAYAGLISVVPKVFTSNFDTIEFGKKVCDATSLVTTLDSIDVKVKPNLKTTITLRNLSLKYVDYQPLFDARQIDIQTNIAALFTNKYTIDSVQFKNAKYADQILPEGTNKIAFLPQAFNSEVFGKKSIIVEPNGPASFKKLKITYVTPTTYREKNYQEKEFTKGELQDFLNSFAYSHVRIK